MLTGEAIRDLLENIKSDLTQETFRLKFFATGKTVADTQIQATEDSGELSVPKHLLTLVEDRIDGGRGRKSGSWAPPDSILEWIVAKGIKPNKPDMPLKTLAYLFNRALFLRGNKVFQGAEGIKLQPIFDRNLDVFSQSMSDLITEEILESAFNNK